ncbi:MAG: ATP-binding cassette domain-containing protein [Rubinisphaera brasiliensis]|uniref:ABC transporter related protein n=1 Tax=Rubinisphaera brasiliensis (strain ATCC 49424 / DSM 5305 / JCM 21570 / IAM 15109 / NBRC 103401 / IFAM 1448) TaxID=756272 RepID=F0SRC6_RUBBR|nr:ABC transporter ATP-binding protein [Rubinisphaera brasiliensis]ADY62377.1 ABC transporter related protein [Rubinisphaera brasiliensis DSM 5305]MBR9803473.1 ATP-binding cassette domain-containing protein [bacterium]
MPAIEVSQLSKQFRVYRKHEGLLASLKNLFHREFSLVEAVKQVSFTIDEGEIVGFLGPNGAGKTTTLKLLSGLVYPSSGEARVLGHVPWKRENTYRRQFALVMGQKNQLWWDLPAQESFRLHQAIYKIPQTAFEKRLDELTSLLEVKKLVSQPVRELSLGERMRMELIASLLHHPRVLFLDEPTIGLDVVSQKRVQQFLKHYQDEYNITVVLTSHYMKDVEALCKRVIIIDEGEIRHDGSLAEVIDRFSRHKVLSLIFRNGAVPDNLERFGQPMKADYPYVKLHVDRERISDVLGALLNEYEIDDVTVLDLPLEDVFAELFDSHRKEKALAAQ